MSEHESQAAPTQKQASVKRKRRPKHEDPPSQEIDEQLGVGKKLTRERKAELIRAIRHGLVSGMHPSNLQQACQTQFRLSRHTVQKYIGIVRSEQIKEVGFYREQIQEICQKALVAIVKKDGGNNDGAKVRAVQMLHSIFDIRVTPEDTSQTQKLIAEEAMAKMDKMSVQELTEFTDNLRSGGEKLTADMLLLTHSDMDEKPRKKKQNSRRNARTS